MKHIEIFASFYSAKGLRDEAEGLAIVACALLYAGIFVWRMIRSMKKEDLEELERERHDRTIP